MFCIFLQKTYEVQDYILYDDATTDKSSNYTFNSGLTVSNNGSEYSILCNTQDSVLNFIDNLDNVSCEFKIKFNSGNCGILLSTDGKWSSDVSMLYYCSQETNKVYHYLNNKSSITTIKNISKSLSSSTYYTMKVTIENGEYSYSIIDNNDSVVDTSSYTTSLIPNNMFGLFNARVGYSCCIKDIKVKAL